ncbi:selenoneine biosynthesis selenosugar synthase SenB [Noviherbaspirillum massiliense]|uniref:selenoneine biosynthesis selenosugar synthase SenB n=1 Tax=Noviherbaspirillum massiliense TaxID=1465823 RepID=UPI0002ECB465|nr:selenoneine biosynthesis selenosugar synthase SenB [Noviherbaspirillum massiliense]
MAKRHVVIISPAMAKANNGNWQTARRWARFLGERYRVTLLERWNGIACDAVIALHARRSASSIASFAAAFPERPCILVLTGTDLYRDIHADAEAQRSLQFATRLVVLQEAGLQELPEEGRAKARVIYQSAPALAPVVCHEPGDAEVVMIGHLRDEKDPLVFMHAAAMVKAPGLRMTHIGGALDPALGEQAMATQQAVPHYRWLGSLPHDATRERLRRSRLMVIASKIEGGANVIIEAVTSVVPVLASDIPGNRGMLGADYAGYFPVGDSKALAALIDKALADSAFHALLQDQCKARAALFAPEREQAAVLQLLDNLAPKTR